MHTFSKICANFSGFLHMFSSIRKGFPVLLYILTVNRKIRYQSAVNLPGVYGHSMVVGLLSFYVLFSKVEAEW